MMDCFDKKNEIERKKVEINNVERKCRKVDAGMDHVTQETPNAGTHHACENGSDDSQG